MTKLDYKKLSMRPFDTEEKRGLYFPMLVYTGMKNRSECPVFKVVLAESPLKVKIGTKEMWGISGYDTETGESTWYAYNDCVSLEDFNVLRRMLATRFGWMRHVSGMAENILTLARQQFKEYQP